MASDDFDSAALLLLREALDLDTDSERNQLLDDRCTGQPQLRDRVRLLLDRIEADEATSETPADVDPLIGSRLGPFRVIEQIGRGGMGRVYRGEREGSDFRQDVAIKLIRRGFDFDDIRARFLRERRILARLSHPNLARFIDGGVAPDLRPWFALEYVRGDEITRWCDARQLDVRARVRIFLDVCAPVQYAHTQLVVHRDLKPGNVLVDEHGSVRLLDFGVAGLLAGDADDASRPSTLGQRHALTPEYAAPEQLAGEDAGVAADVYALGVMLYELIAGVLPHSVDRGDAPAMERALRDAPAPPLTQAIQRNADALAVNRRLSARATTLAAYRADVRGDLSRIIDKALSNEPARRYATAQAFADDLGRWLAGAPVYVSGNGLVYRSGKFIRRHRIGVGLSALAAVAIAALGIYHVATLRAELRETEAQRNRAEASLEFMRNLLASPDPQMGVGADTKLGDFLTRSAATLASNPSLDPDIRAELAVTIADSLKGIDRYDEALAIARDVAAQATVVPTAWPTRVHAATLIGEIQTMQGDYDKALVQLDTATRLAQEHAVTDPLTLANLLSVQSIAYNHLGRWSDSAKLIDRAVVVATPVSDKHPEVFANLLGFASIPRGYPKTDLPGAEALLRRSLAFQEAHGLKATGLYPNTQGELAQTLIDQGRFEEAEPMLLDVVAQMKDRFGPTHRETSFKLNGLALLYFRWNRFDASRRWRDEATAAMRAALGENHPFVALSLIESADLAFYSGDLERAAADATSAAPIADENDRTEFSQRAALYGAALRCAHGDRSAIDPLLERVVALKEVFGVRAFDVRAAAAECLNRVGRSKEALAIIDAFATRLDAGEKIARNDYFQPTIERIRGAALAGPAPAAGAH
ncbi:MAG: protein kinase domain-containing protein [Rhodanobacteraceae bacterium]